MRHTHRQIYYDGPQDGRVLLGEHAPYVMDFMRQYVNVAPGDSVLDKLREPQRTIARTLDRYMLESSEMGDDAVMVCKYRFYMNLPMSEHV